MKKIAAIICVFSFLLFCEKGISKTKIIDLQQAIDLAMTNSPSIKSKLYGVGMKEHQLDAKKTSWYPTLSGNYGKDMHYKEHDGSITISQPIWSFNKISADINYSKNEVNLAKLNLEKEKNKILDKTLEYYISIVGLQQQISVINESIAIDEKLVSRIKRRYQGQLASKADVILSSSRLAQVKADKQKALGKLRTSILNLESLTNTEIESVVNLKYENIVLPADGAIHSLVLSNNTDLLYAKGQISESKRDSDRVKVSMMPTIYLQVTHTYSERSSYANETQYGLYVKANLDGFGFLAKNNIEAAQSAINSAMSNFDYVRLDVEDKYKSYIANRDVEKNIAVTQKDLIIELNKTFDSYERLYNKGRKSWLDILNIAKEISQEKLKLINANNSVLSYKAKLSILYNNISIQQN
ncbi:TolC family protein [Celerinatantimonas sp. MCCC 1A17872]|uniref:TolC family protein n=1 Tax=Celerinatantimonas sp. MCCC 1A17872 TaxID=3177514 RepID=UPI0038C00D8B